MPKKLNDHKMNKGRSELKHQGQKGQRELGRDNPNVDRQPGQGDMPGNMGDRQQQAGLKRFLRNARGMRQENRDRNMANENRRGNNCLSRVLMMALPLVAIGAYLFVR